MIKTCVNCSYARERFSYIYLLLNFILLYFILLLEIYYLLQHVFHLPGSLVLLGVDHGVLDGFVDQRVHVGCEGVDGLHQRLSALRQKLLSVCVHAKLHLTFTECMTQIRFS